MGAGGKEELRILETNWGCWQERPQSTGTPQVPRYLVIMRTLIAATDESKHGSERIFVLFIMLCQNDDKCIVWTFQLQIPVPQHRSGGDNRLQSSTPRCFDVGQKHMAKCISTRGITFCRLQPGTISRLASADSIPPYPS